MDQMTLYILIAAAVLVLYIIFLYNRLVVLRNRINEAEAGIDVQLKRRADLIPNLVETVKGYAKHEKELLENIAKARSSLLNAQTMQEKAEANNMLSDTLKSLFAVSENYPELKANENFLQLQRQLEDTEDKIAYSRQFYNTSVLEYNNQIQVFPSNIVANLFNFTPRQFFSTEDKKNIEVKF
ncbi:MAG: LemA family protein [Patescibacteria group bacterium]|nr:MAG: LemA family protein [Patescibacteria group bacterium]